MRFSRWIMFVILVVFLLPVLAEHMQDITKDSAIVGGLGGAARVLLAQKLAGGTVLLLDLRPVQP